MGPVPAPPGGRGAVTGFIGTVLVSGAVVAPVSVRGAPGTAGAVGGRGATGTTGGAPGTPGGRATGGAAVRGTVAAGGAEAVGTAGGGAAGGGAAGGGTGRGAGGGSGAEGSCTGPVERLGASAGGRLPVTGDTGAVASRGTVAPASGRARSVMRTVSFFKGTAEVFGELGGGGVGVFSSLMMGFREIGAEFL